jgi:hypothetical protein
LTVSLLSLMIEGLLDIQQAFLLFYFVFHNAQHMIGTEMDVFLEKGEKKCILLMKMKLNGCITQIF